MHKNSLKHPPVASQSHPAHQLHPVYLLHVPRPCLEVDGVVLGGFRGLNDALLLGGDMLQNCGFFGRVQSIRLVLSQSVSMLAVFSLGRSPRLGIFLTLFLSLWVLLCGRLCALP